MAISDIKKYRCVSTLQATLVKAVRQVYPCGMRGSVDHSYQNHIARIITTRRWDYDNTIQNLHETLETVLLNVRRELTTSMYIKFRVISTSEIDNLDLGHCADPWSLLYIQRLRYLSCRTTLT